MSKMMHLNYIVDRCSFNSTGHERNEMHRTKGSLDIHTVVRRKNSPAVTFMPKSGLDPLCERGWIGHLAIEDFRVVGVAMSLSIRFEDLDFDFDDIISTDSCSGASGVCASQLTTQIPANIHKFVPAPGNKIQNR
jgi:hypothetical protein